MAAAKRRSPEWYLERLESLASHNDKVVSTQGRQIDPKTKARLEYDSDRLRAAAEMLRVSLERK